jgi:hypothetical protein
LGAFRLQVLALLEGPPGERAALAIATSGSSNSVSAIYVDRWRGNASTVLQGTGAATVRNFNTEKNSSFNEAPMGAYLSDIDFLDSYEDVHASAHLSQYSILQDPHMTNVWHDHDKGDGHMESPKPHDVHFDLEQNSGDQVPHSDFDYLCSMMLPNDNGPALALQGAETGHENTKELPPASSKVFSVISSSHPISHGGVSSPLATETFISFPAGKVVSSDMKGHSSPQLPQGRGGEMV